jgi:hypothetical protein
MTDQSPDLCDLARRVLREKVMSLPDEPLGVHVREAMDATQRAFARLIRQTVHEEVAALWSELTEDQRAEALRYETELNVRIHQVLAGSGKLPTHKQLRDEITRILGPAPYLKDE